jgi:hypothetical protein
MDDSSITYSKNPKKWDVQSRKSNNIGSTFNVKNPKKLDSKKFGFLDFFLDFYWIVGLDVTNKKSIFCWHKP